MSPVSSIAPSKWCSTVSNDSIGGCSRVGVGVGVGSVGARARARRVPGPSRDRGRRRPRSRTRRFPPQRVDRRSLATLVPAEPPRREALRPGASRARAARAQARGGAGSGSTACGGSGGTSTASSTVASSTAVASAATALRTPRSPPARRPPVPPRRTGLNAGALTSRRLFGKVRLARSGRGPEGLPLKPRKLILLGAQAALQVKVLADRIVKNSHGYAESGRLPARGRAGRAEIAARAVAATFATSAPDPSPVTRLLPQSSMRSPGRRRLGSSRRALRRTAPRRQRRSACARQPPAPDCVASPMLAVTEISPDPSTRSTAVASIRSRIRSASSSAPCSSVSGSATTNSSPP